MDALERFAATWGPLPCDPSDMANPLARAQYMLAAHNPQQLPPDGGFEVAFAGRSNAGKSTALNAICQQNALARVSKTPGRTQQLVFFDFEPSSGGPPSDRFLVDLPGYGYAKVPKDLQAHWQAFIDKYFGTREALKGLVVADVHHHHQPLQCLAGAEIAVEERLPVLLQVLGHLGVAVAGQVD